MTKAKSSVGDNDGRCEKCNKPETASQTQIARPVQLGGGLGAGTMWLCPACDTGPTTPHVFALRAPVAPKPVTLPVRRWPRCEACLGCTWTCPAAPCGDPGDEDPATSLSRL